MRSRRRSRSSRQIDAAPRPTPPSVVQALPAHVRRPLRRGARRRSRSRCGARPTAATRRWSRPCSSTARASSCAPGTGPRRRARRPISGLGGQDLGHRSGLNEPGSRRSSPRTRDGRRGRARGGWPSIAGGGLEVRELEMQRAARLPRALARACRPRRPACSSRCRSASMSSATASRATSRPSRTSWRRTSSSGRPDEARPLLDGYDQRARALGPSAGPRPGGALLGPAGRRRRRRGPGARASSTRRSPSSCRSRSRTAGRCSHAEFVLRRPSDGATHATSLEAAHPSLRAARREAVGGACTRRARPRGRPAAVTREPHGDREPGRRARRRGPLEQGGRGRAVRDRQGRRGPPLARSTASSASGRGPS